MDTRILGRTGFEVTTIGAGAWGLGGDMWRGVDPRDAQRALYEAVEAGITLVDTAPVYGSSEVLVGEVIRDLRARDRAVVVTKVPPHHGRWLSGDAGRLREAFPPAYVVASVEQSLRNLRAETLRVAQLQVWDDAWLDDEAWPALRATMQRLIKEGKVLTWGLCLPPGTTETGLRGMEDDLIMSIGVVYNVFEQGCAAAILPRARAREVGVIACAPLDEGSLTGTLTRDTRFPPGDFRARYFGPNRGNNDRGNNDRGNDRLAQAVARADAVRPLLGDEARDLAELALRFCLSDPAVTAAVPGMRRREHVRHDLTTSDGRALSAALRERLREHAWERDWYATAAQPGA